MMRATNGVLALGMTLALGAALAAQDPSQRRPAPAGEGKAVWTAEEARAFTYVQQLAAAFREGRDCDWRWHLQYDLPNWAVLQVQWKGGEPVLLSQRGYRGRHRPGPSLIYLAPIRSGDRPTRAFCVRGDGVAAFTRNAQGKSIAGDDPFEADSVLGAGGSGTLAEFPRMPGRGRDGNFWQPVSMAPQTTVNVMVVDDDGQPMPMCSIACVPVDDDAIDHALPAGNLYTTLEGSAKLTGVPARGLGLVMKNAPMPRFRIASENVTVHGRTVRIVVPAKMLQRQRMFANESAAIATLKNISSAQAQCQASGVIDLDQDGAGEYGTFGELSGRIRIRGSDKTITPPVLSAAFGNVKDGIVTRSGYHFRVFLPGKDGKPVPENAKGGVRPDDIGANQAEVLWCGYAWPAAAGESGQRAFFINQAGDVLAMDNADGTYSGNAKAPSAGAAFATTGGMDAKVAVNRAGTDGNRWTVIQ